MYKTHTQRKIGLYMSSICTTLWLLILFHDVLHQNETERDVLERPVAPRQRAGASDAAHPAASSFPPRGQPGPQRLADELRHRGGTAYPH